MVKKLEKAITEYRERAGEELNPRLQATVLLGTMDEDTAVAAEAKGIGTRSFKEMRQFVEQRYINQQARMVVIGERPHKDLSAVGGEGDEAWTETWEDYEHGMSAMYNQKGKKGGKSKGKERREQGQPRVLPMQGHRAHRPRMPHAGGQRRHPRVSQLWWPGPLCPRSWRGP